MSSGTLNRHIPGPTLPSPTQTAGYVTDAEYVPPTDSQHPHSPTTESVKLDMPVPLRSEVHSDLNPTKRYLPMDQNAKTIGEPRFTCRKQLKL